MLKDCGLDASFKMLLTQKNHFISRVLTLIALLIIAGFINISYAAESSILDSADSYKSNHNDKVLITDSFGRDTPRSTVLGFISALGANDYRLASEYINTSNAADPIKTVRQFKQALDAGGRFHPDLQISNAVQGDLSDQLPPNQERVGSISIDNQKSPLILEKVVSIKGENYWQFSNETLDSVPTLLAYTQPTLIERYTNSDLADKKIFGIH